MRKSKGFTLIELLVVIAIISILAAILLPALSGVSRKAQIAEVKTTINQLSQALKAYETDEGAYPPNLGDTDSGGGANKYTYYDGSIVCLLDGDTSTAGSGGGYGNSRVQYYEFKEGYIENTSDGYLAYKDRFDSKYWYHNFADDNVYQKDNTTTPLYHPHNTRLLFRSFQIYSKIDKPDEPYGGNANKNESTLEWVTNYSE